MAEVSAEEIIETIKRGPGQNVELVKELPTADERKRELARIMTAFANTTGGTVFIGVDRNSRRVIGLDQSRNFAEELTKVDNKYCNPPVKPELTVEKINLKDVGVVNIKRGTSRPYYVDGDCYIRKDSAVYIASHSETQNMYPRKTSVESEKGDGWPVAEASYADLDSKKVEEYIKKIKERLNEDISSTDKKSLRRIGVLTESHGKLVPTAGAMLMLGKEPQNFLGSSSIKVARFKGKDIGGVIIDQKEIRGTIPEMIDTAAQFILKHMSTGAKIEGLERDDIEEYPLVAVREAITNAVVHRDYVIEGTNVRIFMFDNRIEIYTPGGLPDSVTIDNMEYTQYSRNRIITDILINTGRYIEKLGTGIRRIKLTVRQSGLKEPQFFDTGVDFVVVLFGPIDKTWQFRKRERIDRIQQVLGPAKSPQEIGRLPDHKRLHVSHQTGKPHLSRGVQRIARKRKKVDKRLVVLAVLGVGFVILIATIVVNIAKMGNPVIQYKKATVLHHEKEYHKAARAYADFIRNFPNDDRVDDALYYMAASLELAGRYSEALDAYDRLLKKYPRSPRKVYSIYWKGALYLKLGRLDEAIAEYDKVLQKYPDNLIVLAAMRDMALCFEKQGEFEKAIDMYQELLNSKGTSADGSEHYRMGLSYMELGQDKEAKENFEKVISNENAKPNLIRKANEEIENLKSK